MCQEVCHDFCSLLANVAAAVGCTPLCFEPFRGLRVQGLRAHEALFQIGCMATRLRVRGCQEAAATSSYQNPPASRTIRIDNIEMRGLKQKVRMRCQGVRPIRYLRLKDLQFWSPIMISIYEASKLKAFRA